MPIKPRSEWQSLNQLKDKLINARCRLMTREPWYGHICMNMIWTPSEFPWKQEEDEKTMGVRIIQGGVVECLWYPGFVDSQSLKQLYGVIYHEIEHIVRVHTIRIGSGREPLPWNIACDCTINGKRSQPKFGYEELGTGVRVLPLDGKCVWVPEPWEDNQTAEYYYDRLLKDAEKCAGNFKGYGSMLDDHSVWSQSDVSQDEARQIVKDMVQQATAKCQGNVPGHLSDAVKMLNEPIVRWRELLRRYIGRHVGNKRPTFARRNRRRDEFGIKGVSRHAASSVRVIVDTSGSVGEKELSQFFAEIESIAHSNDVRVLLWDHCHQGYSKYRRGEWKRFPIHGRGGTDMAAPVKWLTDNHELGDCQILLTDGYTGWAPNQKWFPELGMITVITQPEPKAPDWGHVVRLRIAE